MCGYCVLTVFCYVMYARHTNLFSYLKPAIGLLNVCAPYEKKNMWMGGKLATLYIIPNFLVLHFGERFIKIWSKIPKLKMYENLHENVNENMFSFTFYAIFMSVYGGHLKQQIFYSFTLQISDTCFLIN